MKWKATQLIEFAAQQNLDAVLLHNLNYFESLDRSHLKKLNQFADFHALRIYIGAGGICRNATRVKAVARPTNTISTLPRETLS